MTGHLLYIAIRDATGRVPQLGREFEAVHRGPTDLAQDEPVLALTIRTCDRVEDPWVPMARPVLETLEGLLKGFSG